MNILFKIVTILLIIAVFPLQLCAAGFIDGGIHVKKYLLQDEFTTDRAAGSVNGTAAEPGPGTRTVADALGTNVSISGGVLSIVGRSVAGDCICSFGQLTRVAGLMSLVNGNTNGGLSNIHATNAINTAAIGGMNIASLGTVVNIYSSSVFDVIPVGSATISTTYTLVNICRTNGNFYFIQGGTEYPQFTLLYSTTTSLGAGNPYFNVSEFLLNKVGNHNWCRVPIYLWLPTPPASDGFGSAFGTTDGLGHAEGIAGGIGAGGGGLTWTGPTWSTSGGKALNTPTVGVEKCNDPGFDDAGQWNDSGTTFVVAGGVATGTLTSDTLTNTGGTAAVVGTWYRLTATITRTAGSVQMGMGGGNGLAISASGTYTQTVRATTTGQPILTGTGFTGTVDNFSVKPLTLSELFASVSPTPATADVYTSVDATLPVVTNACQGGIVMNLDSAATPANFVQVHYTRSTGKVMLVKMVGGVYAADILNVTATYAAGAKLVCRKIGTSYSVWYNNVYIGAATISDAGIISNTLHGVFSTDASGTLDNFVSYSTGSGGEYAILGSF